MADYRRPARAALALGALFLSCLVALLIAEGIFRLAGHRLAANAEWFAAGRIIRMDDSPLGFSLEPNSSQVAVRGGSYVSTARINSAGLHDVEHAQAKAPGTRRILILGDSFMFAPGVPLELNMARQLEGLMGGVEVINAGVPGYSLGQEYLYYMDRGLRHRADLVLLAFFINDLAEPPAFEVEEGPGGVPLSYRRISAAGGGSGVVSWLTDRSLLAAFLTARLGLSKAPAPKTSEPDTGRSRLPPEAAAFRPGPPGGASPVWERAWRILDHLKEETGGSGTRLAIIMIPAPFQTSQDRWDRWVKWMGEPPESLLRMGPQQMLLAWCARTGTPCLDLIDRFENEDANRIYIPHDLHWTIEGHRLAAETVSSFLKQHGLP